MEDLKQWFLILEEDKKEGPFTFAELKQKKERGEIQENTQIWSEKFGEWIPYSEILEKELYYRDTPITEESESTVSFDEEKKIAKERSPRPWVRFWARMIDYSIFFGIISAVGVGLDFFPAPSSPFLLLMLLIFLWVWIESFLLATWGYTPGKWFLKVKIRRREDQQKISFPESMERSLSVWFLGLGGGIPIISLITLIVANVKLSNLGIATWDKRGGFIVEHEKIGFFRAFLTIIFFIAISILFLAEYRHVL